MADNYLEKKMEEHRNRTVVPSRRFTPSGQKSGYAMLPYGIKTAFIQSEGSAIVLETIASAIRATGCRVAISGSDASNLLAQKLSCLFIPLCENCLEVINSKWANTDLIIDIKDNTINFEYGRGNNTIRKAADTELHFFAKRAAELCLYLTLPDSEGRVYGEFYV